MERLWLGAVLIGHSCRRSEGPGFVKARPTSGSFGIQGAPDLRNFRTSGSFGCDAAELGFEFEFGWVRSDSRELSGSFGFGCADRPRQRRERVHQRLRHPARRHAQRIPGQARRCAGSPRHPHDGRQRPRAARPTLDMARFLAGCWRLAGANREAPDGLAQLTSLTHDRNIVHTAPRRHHAHRLAAGLSDGTAPCRKADMLRNRVTRLVVTP